MLVPTSLPASPHCTGQSARAGFESRHETESALHRLDALPCIVALLLCITWGTGHCVLHVQCHTVARDGTMRMAESTTNGAFNFKGVNMV